MSKVNVWLRKKQTLILAVLCSVLMVSWYGGSQLIGALSRGVGKTSTGTLFGRKVPAREFMALQWRVYRLAQMSKVPPDIVTAKAWETLLLAEEARRCGLEVTEADVRDLIRRRFPGRSGSGLDEHAYAAFLDRIGLAAAEYEKLMRDLLMSNLLEEMVLTSVVLPKDEAWLWYSRENRTTQVRYIRLRGEDLAPLCTASDAEVRNFYEEKADTPRERGGYQEPERVQIEYVMAPLAKYAEEVKVTDAEIREYYDSHRDEFRIEAPAEDKETEAQGDTKGEADSTEASNSGAEKDDPGSAASKAGAAEGESSSDTAASDEGEKEEAPKVKPLDEVRDEIARKLRTEKGKRRADEIMRQVNEEIWKALEVPFGSEEVRTVSLRELAEKFNLLYRRPPPFTRAEALSVIPGAFRLPEKAFGQGDSAVKVPGPVMTADEGPFIFQILEIQQAHPAPFEEVAAQVAEDLRRRKGFELARKIAEEAAKAANLDEAKTVVLRLLREAAKGSASIEPDKLFTTGETKFFSAPREHRDYLSGNTVRYLYDIGLAEGHNYARFGDEAFRLNEGQVGWVAEPEIETAFVMERAATRPAQRAKFEEEYERVAPRLLEKKRRAVMKTWRADLLRRAQPSDEVLASLARLPEWQL